MTPALKADTVSCVIAIKLATRPAKLCAELVAAYKDLVGDAYSTCNAARLDPDYHPLPTEFRMLCVHKLEPTSSRFISTAFLVSAPL